MIGPISGNYNVVSAVNVVFKWPQYHWKNLKIHLIGYSLVSETIWSTSNLILVIVQIY